MKFTVITLFPKMIESYLSEGLVGQAVQKGLIEVQTINPREFTFDVHQTVDDRPFGGGDGMVMKPEPLEKAIQSVEGKPHVVHLSPKGKTWSHELAKDWASGPSNVVLISGRYAGIDERIVDQYVDEEVSIGDYVLSGGELPALSIIDSVSRLIPGVLGNSESSQKDSFAEGLLEAPQFTRPREFNGQSIPEFLLSGNHAEIEKVRKALSLLLTQQRRPELLSSLENKAQLLEEAQQVVAEGLSIEERQACGLR